MSEQPVPPDGRRVGRRIGIVGLGTMGAGMAGRLLDRGFDLMVYNRTLTRVEPFRERGAAVADTPAEVGAEVDTVLVSLADQAAVETALFGPGGVLAGLPVGGVVVDTSTVEPAYARSVAERLRPLGRHAVDACALGNGAHARNGELRFMVGGADKVVTGVRPILESLGKEVIHVGESGRGATAKLTLNLLMGVEMQAMAEAVVFGERAGLPRELILQMIARSGFSSPVMKFKAGVMQRAEYDRADFALALMHKDMALISAEAHRLGLCLRATDMTRASLAEAKLAGLGELDCAAMLLHMEHRAVPAGNGEIR
jgi:3-hydroxyisobutyrate dehydrogenase